MGKISKEEFDEWLRLKQNTAISAFWMATVEVIAWVLLIVVAIALFAPVITGGTK